MMSLPPAIEQPAGSQYFESTTQPQWSYISDGDLLLSSGGDPTEFKVIGGNELEQAGTTMCLTYNIDSGYWFMDSPCNGRVTMQFDYETFSTGAESIIAAYNGECMTNTDPGDGVGGAEAQECSDSNVNQRFRWHS